MEKEIWKTIKNYEKYEVSNFGNVRNKETGRLLTKSLRRVGVPYEYVSFNKDKLQIHRLVANAFVENPNPTKFNIVDHIDTNPRNNNYSNLRWTDAMGNMNNPITREKLRERGVGKFIKDVYNIYGQLPEKELEDIWLYATRHNRLLSYNYKLIDPNDSEYSRVSFLINNININIWIRNRANNKYCLINDPNIKFTSVNQAYNYCKDNGLTKCISYSSFRQKELNKLYKAI